jgi:hypothetical protein
MLRVWSGLVMADRQFGFSKDQFGWVVMVDGHEVSMAFRKSAHSSMIRAAGPTQPDLAC